MKNMFLNQAIATAVLKEMEADPMVRLLGEDTIAGGGVSTFKGVYQKFPDRVDEMPIAELAYTHWANGMSMLGYRVVVDLMFSDFASVPCDAFVNGASKFHFNSLGDTNVPVVYVMGNGGRGLFGGISSGVNHSQCCESWYMNIPGLKIVIPYYPEDALGLMRASIRDNDPVLYFYHFGSLGIKQAVEDEDIVIPLNNAAKIRREGTDITILGVQAGIVVAEKAAEELAKEGISCEVIDPRVAIPFDKQKVIDSVKKTGRYLVVQEGPTRGSWGAQTIAEVAMECTDELKAVKLLGQKNAPIGSGFYERYIDVHVEDVVAAAKEMCKK